MISRYLPGFTAPPAQETKAGTLGEPGKPFREFVWPPVKSYSQFSAGQLTLSLFVINLSLKYVLYPKLYPEPVTRFLLIIPNNPEFGNFSTYFFYYL